METATKFFKEENDFLYGKGEAKGEARGEAKGKIKGEEKKSHAVVENLIKFGFTDEQVAEVVEVDMAYLKRIRNELNKK